jgi:hypothetical protein
MGEKEAATSATAAQEADAGKSVQWEPHKAPGLDAPEEEAARARHGASQSAIQNIKA